MKNQKIFNIYQHTDENGDIVGECLEIPVVVQGKTEEEIKEKVSKAINGYFEAFPEEKKIILNSISLEILCV